MKRKIRIYILMVFTLTAALADETYSQTFQDARKLAFDGEHAKARQICRTILSTGFDSDVALLIGRTYAWDAKYDSARIILNEVLIHNPDNLEALDALADVEFWSENYEKAVGYCDRALLKEPENEDFILKKARILYSSEKYEEAVVVLEDYVRQNPDHTEVYRKLQEYRMDVMKNNVKLAYSLDYFGQDSYRNLQMTSLSYGHKTKFGKVIARVNMANRNGDTGFQYELDAYPKLGENNYGYLNYGYSSANSLFPENRLGFEWYHSFPKAFEGSLGMRKLFFSSSDVNIFTGYVGKYAGNYWFSLRSFVTPGDNGTSVSGLLLVRRYFSDPEDYVGVRLGTGFSPDDNQNIINSGQNPNLNTRSVRGEFNHLFNRMWIFNTGFTWNSEELETGSYSSYYTFDISISRLF